MFYKIKKDGVLLENFNAPANADAKHGQGLTGKEADAAALARSLEIGGTSVETSDGRTVS